MSFEELLKHIENNEQADFINKAQKTNLQILLQRDKQFSYSLLNWAAYYERIEVVKFLCENYPQLLTPVSGFRTPLHCAARAGNVEIVKCLLKHLSALEMRDGNNKTALDLAIQYGHTECARALLNAEALLHTGDFSNQNPAQIFHCVAPRGLAIYCDFEGTYQLLTQEELKQIEQIKQIKIQKQIERQNQVKILMQLRNKSRKKTPAQGDTQEDLEQEQLLKELENLSLEEPPLSFNSPFTLTIGDTPEQIQHQLFMLIDKYLYLCNKRIKEERERRLLPADSPHHKNLLLSQRKRSSLLQIIKVLVASLVPLPINLYLIDNEAVAQGALENYLRNNQAIQGRYFGDDLSDDSDSEEEKAYTAAIAARNGPSPKNIENKYLETKQKVSTQNFWLRTKANTPGNAGLRRKVQTMVGQLKNNVSLDSQIKQIPKIIDRTLNSDLIDRGTIHYDWNEVNELTSFIKTFNEASPENKIKLLQERKTPTLIMGIRGSNYMLDRWNANARRYHRGISEEQRPMYSEAVLKTLNYDFYRELDPTHDYYHNIEDHLHLQKEALALSDFLEKLHKTEPCIHNSVNHTDSPYIFNDVGGALQDHFSNGVNNHLKELADLREKYPEYWGKYLKNAFNNAIAIGSRPRHALNYALGLKNYYPQSMLPRYWCDGTLEYPHVGKVYLSLHSLEEILSQSGINDVSLQDRNSQVSLADLISPEKELSFRAFLPGDSIFHQLVVRFPSFKGPYKHLFEVKYGLDKNTYEAFKYLISVTQPDTKERNAIIELLSEWLCAFNEVLLIDKARDEALKRGGHLLYVNREGNLSLEPDNGRIFTGGESNRDLRNEVHIFREIRKQLAVQLSQHPVDEKSIPGYKLINHKVVESTLRHNEKSANFLSTIAAKDKIKLSVAEKGKIASNSATEITTRRGHAVRALKKFQTKGLGGNNFFKPTPTRLTHLSDVNHLYIANEINTLLEMALDHENDTHIYAAQQPLAVGEFAHETHYLFSETLKRIFRGSNTAIMPIETSQGVLDNNAYSHIVGNHWIGLCFRKIGDNNYCIEVMDSAHSPNAEMTITAETKGQLPRLNLWAKLFDLFEEAATQSGVRIEMKILPTTQQSGDLDCGAWAVDNLTRRAQNLPLRTRNEIAGNALRQEQNRTYHHGLRR